MIFVTEIVAWYALLLLAAKVAGREGLIAYVISAAIMANMETTQLVEVFGLTIPGGIVPFACLFLATDVSSELFGRRFSWRLMRFSALAMLLSSLLIGLFSRNEGITPAYEQALGSSLRVALASATVYYLCGMIDIRIYHGIGQRVRFKWLRNNTGTITAQLLNAFLFIILALGWIGWQPILNNWLISAGLALIDTPMIYLITGRDRLLPKEAGWTPKKRTAQPSDKQ